MEPNTNQPEGVNPIQQTAPQPVPAPAQPVTPIAPQNVAENPKKEGGKRIILIILILILIIGMGVYILFAKSQLNNTQKTSTNTTAPIPQSISQPTSSQDDLNIESPEADLQGLDADVNGL